MVKFLLFSAGMVSNFLVSSTRAPTYTVVCLVEENWMQYAPIWINKNCVVKKMSVSGLCP
ncbi:hypothetical protein Bca4012_083086 [Brassica carinata]